MARYTKDVHFENKVISQADLTRLIEIFAKLEVKRKKNTNYTSILERQDTSFSITSEDGVDYDFNTKEISALNTQLQTKQINRVYFRYKDYKTNNELSFRLGTTKYSSSYFQITSAKQEWFNDKKATVEEFLISVKEQQNFYLSNRKWIKPVSQFILAIPFTILLVLIAFYVSKILLGDSSVESTPKERILAAYWLPLLLISFNYLTGELVISKFFQYLDSMWPSIELEAGPSHANKIRNTKKAWRYAISVIIIPTVLAIIFYALPH